MQGHRDYGRGQKQWVHNDDILGEGKTEIKPSEAEFRCQIQDT